MKTIDVEDHLSAEQRKDILWRIKSPIRQKFIAFEEEKKRFNRRYDWNDSKDKAITFLENTLSEWKKRLDIIQKWEHAPIQLESKWVAQCQQTLNEKINQPYLRDYPKDRCSMEEYQIFWDDQYEQAGLPKSDWSFIEDKNGDIVSDVPIGFRIIHYYEGVPGQAYLKPFLRNDYERYLRKNLPETPSHNEDVCQEMIAFIEGELSDCRACYVGNREIEAVRCEFDAGFNDNEYRAIASNFLHFLKAKPTEKTVNHFVRAFIDKSTNQPMVWDCEKTKRTPRALYSLYEVLWRLGYLSISQSEFKKLIIANFVDENRKQFELSNPFSRAREGLKEELRKQVILILQNSLKDQNELKDRCETAMWGRENNILQ